MNFVKGVTDLIRRSSGGQTGEGVSWSHVNEKLSAPSPRIRFGDIGDEAVLGTLWQRYENTIDKTEKRKLLQVFLLHFIQTYKSWDPVYNGQTSDMRSMGSEDVLVGCSVGHPFEVILVLIQEIARITSLVSDLNNSASQGSTELLVPSMSLSFSTEGVYVLDCLIIITRSVLNSRVFGYYGGVQKVTALMKAAVIQLKTLTSAFAVDEQLSSASVERIRILQKILVYVVFIISSFMNFHSVARKDVYAHIAKDLELLEFPISSQIVPASEAKLQWQRRAVVLVMESGGVNWLVELLRVMRRLNLKEQWTDLSLQYLTLGTLRSALSGSPRAQNHFKSIGGLEVLLDGLGLPSSKCSVSKNSILTGDKRDRDHIFGTFELQILSLEVLRESTFGNLNNLQYLCENGRIHKLANSICWPAFMLQEFQQESICSAVAGSPIISLNSSQNPAEIADSILDQTDSSNFAEWSEYVSRLSKALCSFLLAPEDIKFRLDQAPICQSSIAIPLSYLEYSIRWVMKVLLTVFPCIKACASANELPVHLRILANTLQHSILCAFRKLLVTTQVLLEVFREEGIWDLIFSENFFYFGVSREEIPMEIDQVNEIGSCSMTSNSDVSKNQAKTNEVDILQVEAISFLEFAATLSGNANNLPECSVLLDTLEQSSCNPEIAGILLKSLHRILQLAVEQTVASFNSLNAIARVLKVACIQAQELHKLNSLDQCLNEKGRGSTCGQMAGSMDAAKRWIACMEFSLEIFSEYISTTDDARILILHNSSCVDCLFDMFWEENLRKNVLEHILEFLKLPASSAQDQIAKLQLCSRFLETFTRAKERETCFAELSIDLLISMREILLIDAVYYQKLFRDGECFLHIVSLLNGSLDESTGEKLLMNVLQTLTLLLSGNDESKVVFRSLVGVGYQTLQSLVLDFCKWHSSEQLLNALLDMLVDGKFDLKDNAVIKNDDAVLLFINVLQKSSTSLQHYGLNVLVDLLKDSIANRISCSKAGILKFLFDWFSSLDENDDLISKIAQLIQVVGGHSISGTDIRKIFALLRSEKIGHSRKHSSLLLSSIRCMLKEKGPAAFFDFSGNDSGIEIKTPFQWPSSKGFSFTCWVRVEDFPKTRVMGLFCFLTDSGRGCVAMLGKDKLYFESINQKRHSVQLPLDILPKQWHFLCITHSIGRAFSGGSFLRCYVDGNLISSEKCRYTKVSEFLTCCTIGKKIILSSEENSPFTLEKSDPFAGQIGPLYLFGDSLSSEQIIGIYSLGPSYMYSFLSGELHVTSDTLSYNGILDPKEGLSSKIILGLNAQARDGRTLFNVSSVLDNSSDKSTLDATVMDGAQLCSRCMLQEIIYCVGGVSVFFPLLIHLDRPEIDNRGSEYVLIKFVMRDKVAPEVIELIASVLDGNVANQRQMHLLSGFSILGFLFQSIPPQQLNMDILSSLKYLFEVLRNCAMSELLLKDAILSIYLSPHIWLYTNYEVQRDLYMYLIQFFEDNQSSLATMFGLPWIIDIVCQFYWDKTDSLSAVGAKPLLHSTTRQVIGERPGQEEVRKIRLLLLSLGEMSLRQTVSVTDVKALIAFFERSLDMVCVEDILHMVIRALSQMTLLASFLEHVNVLGGCHIFVNLLQRDLEPIRLLGLQLLGKLLVGLPPEKKETRFFSLAVGRSKSIFEHQRKDEAVRQHPNFSAISERLFRFPLSDHLRATLFDVLLGGASPKQVLQMRSQSEKQKCKKDSSLGISSHFLLPQILVCIFKFLASCTDTSARQKVLSDLLDLLDSNPSNTEALMEHGWNSWLLTSVRLLKNCDVKSKVQDNSLRVDELSLVRNLFCVVLSHYMYSVKGGWRQLEDTVTFLLLNFEQGELLHPDFVREIFEDLIGSLVDLSAEENIFVSQPCRDNSLYLLKLIDEMLIGGTDEKLLVNSQTLVRRHHSTFPRSGSSSDMPSDSVPPEEQKYIISAVNEILNAENGEPLRVPFYCKFVPDEDNEMKWWNFYDKVWILISEMSGKGPSKIAPKGSVMGVPSFGQRARGLVESLNIPAAEMAAVVVSGGISNALGGKTNKYVDKAMLLRGEKFPRIIFHLVVLYLCEASLERASRCVQQFISLLPSLLVSDDDQSKNRLHFFIWSLLTVRSQYGGHDDGARFHVISHLLLETISFGKTMLASSLMGRKDFDDGSVNIKEAGTVVNLIQRDRILAAVGDEAKYMRIIRADRLKQLQELRVKLDEYTFAEVHERKAFEDEMQTSISKILSSDDSRKASSQLAYDEEQQIVAEKWIHMFRALIDERGPWSANPFPNNSVTHWKLDKTEDTLRRRPKLKRNYHFDEKLCHPTNTKSASLTGHPASEPSTGMIGHVSEQMKRFLLKGVRGVAEEGTSEPCDDSGDLTTPNESCSDYSENQGSNAMNVNTEQLDLVQDRKNLSSTADSEPSQAQLTIRCVLLTPKRKLAGHLAVMQNVLHFSADFLVEGTGGSSVFNSFEVLRDTEITKKFGKMGGINKQKMHHNTGLEPNQLDKIKRHRRWNISKIKAVHWTRYLLQYTAIEIFFNNSVAPIFLNFASQKDAKQVGTLIVSLRNESLFPSGSSRDKTGVISFVDRHVATELAESSRESWRRREISNFEYLMILNTLAGRSYNDLTQYPVFPWVLADYSSEKLDFNKSSTFRDLSKPVGALDLKRFQVFEERYCNFSDPDIPSFYYGSHYSSMGIVLFYLLRLEPFTALHRNLQGGKFDHADRLFQSIDGTYKNCMSNTSDVKELIPEFFYMPEFVVNSNSYHLGVKQDGEPLGDVGLPPWAKGSPEEFIYRNREALESEYVSSNLHHWIDLVFGYKQRGKPAVEAANVFYYLTYEGAVDLETMDDLVQKSAIEDQIANFGQTPIQIFRKKHPRRGPPVPISHPLYFAPASITLSSVIPNSNATNPPSPILFVGLMDSNIVVVNEGLTFSIKMWLTTQLQYGGNFTFSGSQEPFFGIGSDVFPPRKISTPLSENIEFTKHCLATMQTSNENYMISCGNWENSFQVISLNDGRMVQSIRQHKDVVSCVSVTSDGSILGTGSYDTTVMIWHARARSMDKRLRSTQADFPRRDHVIIENPLHILCGHDDIITCLFISLELDIVISGSKDGTCIFHTLRQGRYLRSIQHPSKCALSKLVASQHGRLVFYADSDLSLHMYSINGKHTAFSELNGRLNCMEISSCGDFLVCAGDQGHIVLRSMHSLDMVRRYEGIGKIITSLTVTPEECFIAGTKDGSLLVYSIENPQLRKPTLPRNTKSKSSAVG